MDNTPQSYQNSSDSGCYFDISRSLFESTPKTEYEGTPVPYANPRKRKASYLKRRNLADVTESSSLPSPQFSSTFNESLTSNLENFHIQLKEDDADSQKGGVIKIFENSEHAAKRIRSAPNTPEKQVKYSREIGKKANTNSFIKNFSQVSVQSPLNKEAYGILYPNLTPLEPVKKPATPQKFKENLEKNVIPVKKCLLATSHKELFRKVCTNIVVMSNIFKYLSDGDLYRVSMVSRTLYDALVLDMKAWDRYQGFLHQHRSSKENYRITPPKSPEKDDNTVEVSPSSKNFYYFHSVTPREPVLSTFHCPWCQLPRSTNRF